MATKEQTVALGDQGDEKPALRRGARTKSSQEKGWKSVLDVAKRFATQRPGDHISSLLAELRELNISRKSPGRYYTTNDALSRIAESILGPEGKKVGDDFYYPDVRNGKYTLGHVSPIRYLSRFIRPDTTAVMELGSGWSSNLFQLYIAHGKTRSKKIIYYGGEYTKEGQTCAKFISSLEEGLAYRSFRFDYRNPNVEFLVRQRGHILLFTNHSIEQVDVINPILFEQLREISNPVTVVHFEPVGWQRVPELMQARDEQDDAFFEQIGARAEQGLNSPVENAAWWSWRLEYNVNLLKIVNGLSQRGAIDIRRIEYDFNGLANIFNPSTLVHYDFVR